MPPVASSTRHVRAVLWDFGGVITSSPFDAFAAYERDHGLPSGFIRHLNAINPDRNAWAALERGHVDLDTFAPVSRRRPGSPEAALDGHDVLDQLTTSRLRPEMVEAVRRCHERTQTALLTNNFVSNQPTRDPEGRDRVLSYFDVVLESSSTGYRKPDPHIYRMALDLLGVDPTEAVFLDDLGINLKPARAHGDAHHQGDRTRPGPRRAGNPSRLPSATGRWPSGLAADGNRFRCLPGIPFDGGPTPGREPTGRPAPVRAWHGCQ